MRRRPPLLILAALLVTAVAAQTPSSDVESDLPTGGFSLIPKVFQRNPTLEMTVFTEVTDYGKDFAPAALDAPQYYELSDQGRQSRGMAMAGDRGPSREELQEVLQHALSVAGYRAADAAHPATLALVWYWGSHNAVDADLARQFPELTRQYILERAVLVGGKDYAAKLGREFSFGETDMSVSGKKEFLRMQVAEDLYFVVVSAYALADIARHEHKALWRTMMTVNTRGLSMRESLPTLIVTAADYFGRATTDAVALRRAVRRGTVKLGPMQILESGVPASMAVPGK